MTLADAPNMRPVERPFFSLLVDSPSSGAPSMVSSDFFFLGGLSDGDVRSFHRGIIFVGGPHDLDLMVPLNYLLRLEQRAHRVDEHRSDRGPKLNELDWSIGFCRSTVRNR